MHAKTVGSFDEIATGFDLFQTISIGQSIYTKEMTVYGKIVQSRMLVTIEVEPYMWEKVTSQHAPETHLMMYRCLLSHHTDLPCLMDILM
ncbi:hypothetical protein JNUCC42_15450 [Brevibacterium sp. JNUCC-42]|nr:hypothetical protein JNUCC42_15450 [Brevibacterium sp. JNUCC-42]